MGGDGPRAAPDRLKIVVGDLSRFFGRGQDADSQAVPPGDVPDAALALEAGDPADSLRQADRLEVVGPARGSDQEDAAALLPVHPQPVEGGLGDYRDEGQAVVRRGLHEGLGGVARGGDDEGPAVFGREARQDGTGLAILEGAGLRAGADLVPSAVEGDVQAREPEATAEPGAAVRDGRRGAREGAGDRQPVRVAVDPVERAVGPEFPARKEAAEERFSA